MTVHKRNIRIAILDDHQIIIDGLKLLLQAESRLEVVLESNNGYDLLDKMSAAREPVDIILLDLMMPGISGFEVAGLLNEKFPDTRIVVLTMNTDADTSYNLIETTDIRAFLPKSVNKHELIQAIYKVNEGSMYFHEEILEELQKYHIRVFEKEQLMLSPREREVITLIAKGLSNKEIAASLFISEFTVATHRKNIFRKTNTHNAAALVELANRLRLL